MSERINRDELVPERKPRTLNAVDPASRCMKDLQAMKKPYPRTCEECGLGPCKRYPTRK